MTMHDDPIRLSALATPGSVLSHGLAAARSSEPSDEQLRELERHVLAGLGLAGAMTATATGASEVVRARAAVSVGSWLSTGTAKLILVLLATTAVVGGVLGVRHLANNGGHARPASSPAFKPAATFSQPEPVPTAPTASRVVAPAAPSSSASAPAARAPSLGKQQGKPHVRSAAIALPAQGADDEMLLLKRANEALALAPARALALADAHKRRFPDAVMDQERELIAVTALDRLGRFSEARRRAQDFLHAHPSSIYRAQMQAFIGRAR
jgi:hypothetical protein